MIVLLGLGISFIVCIIIGIGRAHVDDEGAWHILTGIGVVALLILLGSIPCSRVGYQKQYGEWRGFVMSFPAYEEAIQRSATDAVIPVPESNIHIGLENMSQSQEITKLIVDKREAILKYNIDLMSLSAIQNNVWTRWWIVPIPSDLKPIKIVNDLKDNWKVEK